MQNRSMKTLVGLCTSRDGWCLNDGRGHLQVTTPKTEGGKCEMDMNQ